jgi:hypothetical protein
VLVVGAVDSWRGGARWQRRSRFVGSVPSFGGFDRCGRRFVSCGDVVFGARMMMQATWRQVEQGYGGSHELED